MIISTIEEIFLVYFLATKEALALLANDPIMSGRLIRSFRHLECQNPSIISDSIGIPNGGEKNDKKWGGPGAGGVGGILFI